MVDDSHIAANRKGVVRYIGREILHLRIDAAGAERTALLQDHCIHHAAGQLCRKHAEHQQHGQSHRLCRRAVQAAQLLA